MTAQPNSSDLTATSPLLDYEHPAIRALIAKRGWRKLSTYDAIGAVYDFARDEIKFGYNRDDAIAASEVLSDGIGQCNTKATLLMALLRALGVRCRLHGFTIHKNLQRGVVPESVYRITPENIIHSWVEIDFEGQWINLEGFILDAAFLNKLQAAFMEKSGAYCGYGAGTQDLQNPEIGWTGQNTYIQSTAINQDFGLFDTPDQFYILHRQEFSPPKKWLYIYFIRHWMNRRVESFRSGKKFRPLPAHVEPQATVIQIARQR